MERWVGRALLRLTGLALLVVALVAAVDPRRANIEYHWWVVAPTMLAALALAFVARGNRVGDVLRRAARPRWVGAAVAATGAVAGTVVGQSMSYRYGWDAHVVMQIARGLHRDGVVGADAYDYLSRYPNNIPLLVIDRLGVELGAAWGLSPDAVLITVNGLSVGVTLYAVHAVVRRVSGRAAALAAQLVLVVLVALSPWMSVPYTDLPSMPFVFGGLALLLVARERRRLWATVVVGALGVACIAVAYVIKTTPAVVVVALVLTAVVAALGRSAAGGRRLRVVAGALACVVGVGLVFAGTGTALDRAADSLSGLALEQVQAEASPPVLWWVANGMSEQRSTVTGAPAYGTYSRAMVLAISHEPREFMTEYARDYIDLRLRERGPGGMASFYGNKILWNWGDGMFWAWGEGGDARPGIVHSDSPLTRWVDQFNGLHGQYYSERADVTQGLWLALLVVAGLGLLRAPHRREVLALALTVLGIAAFTMVFQGRSRYLFVFVPVVAALAGSVQAHLPRVRLPGRRPDRLALSRSTR